MPERVKRWWELGPEAPMVLEALPSRDTFAAAALTGMLANPHYNSFTPEQFAAEAYTLADAMLRARP